MYGEFSVAQMQSETPLQQHSGAQQGGSGALSASVQIRRLTGALGAEVDGVDLGRPLPPDTKATLDQLILDHSVLVFRNQTLSPLQLAALGRQFGELEEEPFIPKLEGHEGVYLLSGAGGSRLSTQNLHWHVDHSYREVPSYGTFLYAIDVPAAGGDTLFASMYHAYDALSAEMKRIVDGLVVIHDVLQYGLNAGHMSLGRPEVIGRFAAMRQRFPQIEHPLVCTHPETGRKFLYINPAWASGIKGMTPAESGALLAFLNAHATQQAKFQCRVHWTNGTVVFWDNRCVQHSPTADYTDPRIMHRVAIAGRWRPH
ncbi:MAG: TauD/TfdA family dioxygenase [Rhodospirillaceae bacterium]|nr:TauD/TfdA family dioxygenase [Rhodospirillaceae bacterium]